MKRFFAKKDKPDKIWLIEFDRMRPVYNGPIMLRWNSKTEKYKNSKYDVSIGKDSSLEGTFIDWEFILFSTKDEAVLAFNMLALYHEKITRFLSNS